MNISHYPSLELCKKLTEIGFPKTEKICELFPEKYPKTQWNIGVNCAYSPSVMEMLDVMPPLTGEHWLSIEKCTTDYHVCMRANSCYETIAFDDSILPNALASMILWLVENNYISFNK